MAKAETLQRIAADVEAGRLGKAISRCQGLVHTYPEDLSLREVLGNLYYRVHYLEEAGRYWYLVDNKSPEQIRVCHLFETSVGNSAQQLLRKLCIKQYQRATGEYGSSKNPVIQMLFERAEQEDSLFAEPYLKAPQDVQTLIPPQNKLKDYLRQYRERFWMVFSLFFLGLLIIWMILGMKVFFTELLRWLNE